FAAEPGHLRVVVRVGELLALLLDLQGAEALPGADQLGGEGVTLRGATLPQLGQLLLELAFLGVEVVNRHRVHRVSFKMPGGGEKETPRRAATASAPETRRKRAHLCQSPGACSAPRASRFSSSMSKRINFIPIRCGVSNPCSAQRRMLFGSTPR